MKIRNVIKIVPALALATLAIHQTTFAGSHTWSGASDIYFSNAANWSVGGPPTAGEQDVYLFFPAGATRYSCSNNITGLTVKKIVFSGTNYGISGKPITILGGETNITSTGTLNGMSTPLILVSNVTFNLSSGTYVAINSVISGSGGLTLSGAGILSLNGLANNTYSGTTYVNGGTLQLAGGAGLNGTIPGALVIGTPVGSAGTAIVKLTGQNQIAESSPVTINFTGVLNANNNVDWIGGLVIAGGQITTGTGAIHMLGDVTVQPGTSYIYGNFGVYGTNRVFNAAPGGTLNIKANFTGYLNNPGFIKTGAGAVNLYGTNTFDGPVLVTQGYLSLYSPGALGKTSGLTVTNLGIVQMFGVGITNVALKLCGNGNGNGALRAFGTNTWEGLITLTGNAGIQPLAATDLLKITGGIGGTGNLTKLGAGTLLFGGTAGNAYNGTTTVSQGTLQLSTSSAIAIPGKLIIGDATNAPFSRIVKLTTSQQIADQADVIVNASGSLAFAGNLDETIGSLAGAGNVDLYSGHLIVGTNGANTTFSGAITGLPNSSRFEKQGSGILEINGDSPGFSGLTAVSGGTLSLNGSFPVSGIWLSAGMLSGNAVVGPVHGASKVAPGNSAGSIYSQNFLLTDTATLEIELNGVTGGVDYDQVNVSGSVLLGSATLNVVLGFASAISNQFVIIRNDGSEAVTNTFRNLPEGTNFYAGGAQFHITYKGGDGNDVVLTQMSLPAPSYIGGVTRLPNGQIQISGAGNVGMMYGIEANSDLGTTNWVNIGMVQANQLGEVSFTDTNAPNFAMRFYRLKAK